MGRKSKAKANKNNQQAARVTPPNANQSSNCAPKNEAPDEAISEITPNIVVQQTDPPPAANVAAEPPAVKEEEQQQPEDEDTGAEFSQVGKKKRNRNRNKKKNQQNVQEVDESATVPEEIAQKSLQAEVAKDVQNREETPEKALNAPSKRSQRNNKKKNAEKANQVASADENRIDDEAIADTLGKANESGDNVAATEHKKVPTENLSQLAEAALQKPEKKVENKQEAKPEVPLESSPVEKPEEKLESPTELKSDKFKADPSFESKSKTKEKSQNKNESKTSVKQSGKDVSKSETKPPVKPDIKSDVETSTKQGKQNKKTEKQTESKQEITVEVKEAQPEIKSEAPASELTDTKPEITTEIKEKEKSKVKSDTVPEIREESVQSEVKTDTQPILLSDVKLPEEPEVKTEVKSEDKSEAEPVIKTDEQPEVKPLAKSNEAQTPVSEKKQEGKLKGDKSPKKQQKQQKTDQKANEKKTKPDDKSTELKTPADETKELAKLVNIASKVEVPLVDPITVEISQPLVITSEVCRDKPEEPSTESTLAQLIELVSNTDIPLQDVCLAGVKEKMANFQKPIAETGAALAELVNVVAGVEVPLKDVELPQIENRTDQEQKGKKGKQQKGMEARKPDAKKIEAKPAEVKKDNKKIKEARDDKDSAVKDKPEAKESKEQSQEAPKLTSQTEESKKQEVTEKAEATKFEEKKEPTPPKKTDSSSKDSKPDLKPSIEAIKQSGATDLSAVTSKQPKIEQPQLSKIEETKLVEQPKPTTVQSEPTAPTTDQATSSSPNKSQNTTPAITKKNKDDANAKAAKEKSEAKAKEVPEKNPQEKMDAISFVPDKLIDILDTKMQTLPAANTGAIKKIPKQKAEQEKESTDMGAQTQISVLPTFQDKPKVPEEAKKETQQVQQKQDKSGKTSPQKSPPKSPAGKKPQIPPKPEHLLKKSAAQHGAPKEVQKQEKSAPKKPPIMSDDEEEFIEYKFTPRQVFLATICQICKLGLQNPNPCSACLMVSYCSEAHAKEDAVVHQPLCRALQEIARKRGGHVYNNAKILSNDDFRNLRVHTLNLCESLTQRPLQPFEKEILIFPRICCTPTCREWRPTLLMECQKCGQVSYCREQPNHLSDDHQRWCPFFLLYQKLIVRQKTTGRIEPALPSRIFLQRYELPATMDDVFKELYKNNPAIKDDCSYATLTQLATAPLTAFSALQKTQINVPETLTIHLVGAELQFEGDTLDKWEAFFLHLIPQVLELRVVFIGPELNAENLPLDILSRIRMCRTCRQSCRGVKFDFQCGKLYHDYAKQPAFTKPDLICFFNPGLYRATGFSGLDTWPETIKVTTSLNCPIVVTSYTEVEAPQDLTQLHRATARPLNLLHPPTVNPFSSQRPERNFISDEVSPMIFKNYFVFIVS